MKKLFLAATALLSLNLVSQDNYTIKMSVKVEGLPEEYAGMAENDIITYMKGEKSKTELTSMMMTQVSLNDGEKTTTLMEQMGNKTGWVVTKTEAEADEKKAANKRGETKPVIEYVDDKKTIAGYECSKAIVTTTNKEKKEQKTIVWYTEKIKQPSSTGNKSGRRGGMMGGADLSAIKGFPMQTEMSMNNQGMEMKVISTVTEVSTAAIDDKIFTIDTEGYKIMSYKELKESMKAQQD
jgi:hypothetical protein